MSTSSLNDIALFAQICFGWKAFDYQQIVMNDQSKRQAWVMGRQVGKTEMAAIRGLYNAVMNPGTTTLIISPTQRQSGILFRRMKYFLNLNSQMPKDMRIPLKDSITRETQTVIEFENGSEIHSLPASEDGSNIRGFTAHMIIIDEAAYIRDEVYHAISPMLATTGGALILIGTPYGMNNYFYKVYKNPEMGFKGYHFPSRVSPLIGDDFLKEEAKRVTDLEFRQEYLAEFIESVGSMFTAMELDEIMDDEPLKDNPHPHYEYYLGYDPARFGEDDAVGVILEKRPKDDVAYTVAIFEQKGSLEEQARMLEGLHKAWGFSKIVLDTTGLGASMGEQLKHLPLLPFVFTIKSKEDSYFYLKSLIEAKTLKIPSIPKLRSQMLELKREMRADGHTKIFHPRGRGHDDYPTALALACWGLKQPVSRLVFATGKGFFKG